MLQRCAIFAKSFDAEMTQAECYTVTLYSYTVQLHCTSVLILFVCFFFKSAGRGGGGGGGGGGGVANAWEAVREEAAAPMHCKQGRRRKRG